MLRHLLHLPDGLLQVYRQHLSSSDTFQADAVLLAQVTAGQSALGSFSKDACGHRILSVFPPPNALPLGPLLAVLCPARLAVRPLLRLSS